METERHDEHGGAWGERAGAYRDRIWIGRAARLFCLIAGGGVIWVLLRFGLPCLLPFALAWGLSYFVRRGAQLLERKLSLPRRVGACLLLLAVLLPLCSLAVTFAEHLLCEAQQLMEALGSGEGIVAALEHVADAVERVSRRIPFPVGEDLFPREQLAETLTRAVSETLARWSASIPTLLGNVIRRFPVVLILLVTFVLALLYCCMDDGRIASVLQSLIPPVVRPQWQRIREVIGSVGVRYLRAYALLFGATFLQLVVGFLILRLPYVFLPALLIALLDVLPVLGVGTALIPWGAVALLSGDRRLGLGLLVLYAVMLLLRQLLEPRVIGASLGLHPLAALLALWTGLCLGGVIGMVLAPAVTVVLGELWRAHKGQN